MTLQKYPVVFNLFKVSVLSTAALSLTLLSGCSTMNDMLKGDKIDYKTAGKAGPSLEVPPD
jgi:outer membrane protein assembly factor BamC